MYAITRGKKAIKAWYWRVTFSRRGMHYFRTFYDLKHGGEKKALAAAVAWRDRQLAGAKILTYREFCAYRRSNNTSGVAGVHFLKTPRQPRGYWQAKIKLSNGKKVHSTFSVKKFGAREAFKRAVAARAQLRARRRSALPPRRHREEVRDAISVIIAECLRRFSVSSNPMTFFESHSLAQAT